MSGCCGFNESGTSIPESVDQVVFDTDSTYPKMEFQRDVVYMDSLLLDIIHDIDVDSEGTVYMAGEKWNHLEVHKFSAEGDYLGSIGSLGKEPGSFLRMSRIDIRGTNLWVSDAEMNRLTRFDAGTGKLQHVVELDSVLTLLKGSAAGNGYAAINPVGPIQSNRFMVTLSAERNPAYQPQFDVDYALISSGEDDSLNTTQLFKGKARRYVVGDYAGRPVAFSLEINERPLADFNAGGLIYTANSSDFYIRVFNQEGAFIRTYRYPYERFRLDPQQEIFPSYTYNRQLFMVRESADYPEFWPALYHMFLDDEQRLWVSSVTANRNIAEWFVIDDRSQSLVSRFNWPVDKPFSAVRNGYAYAIEKNSAGFKIVVRYKIQPDE